MFCRILRVNMLLAASVLAGGAWAQGYSPDIRPANDIIQPGKIILIRTEAALSPQTEASWEARLQRQMAEAQQSMRATTADQLAQMRDENTRLQQQITNQQVLLADNVRARDEAAQAKWQLLSAEVENRLNIYAHQQLADAKDYTNQALAVIAKNARMDVLELQKQTAGKLAEIRDDAGRKAEALANERAVAVEQKLAQAVAEQNSPEQIKQLAGRLMAESAPEMRALALQTLSDSQNYIKTVARDAVKDEDPAVQEALQNAAKNVIMKDDKVVFAIRQAMARQVAAENGATVTAGLAPAGEAGMPADVNLNTGNLAVTPPAEAGGVAQVVAGLGGQKTSMLPARNRRDWVDLRKYRVVVHEDGKTLQQLLGTVLSRAEPFTGPWQVKWKISPENTDILTTKFSLDTETSFEEFVSYLAQYLVNDRGVKLTFSMFDRDRILVISD